MSGGVVLDEGRHRLDALAHRAAQVATSMPIIAGTNSAHCTGSPASRLRSSAITLQPRARGCRGRARARRAEPEDEDVRVFDHAGTAARISALAGAARRAPGLHGAAGMLLLRGPADRLRDGHGAVGGKGDAVEAGHHRIGVGHAPVHARRPRAAEQHLRSRKPRARLAGRSRPTSAVPGVTNVPGLRIERHDHHQHERVHPMAAHDVERRGLAEQAAVVQADDDVRHDLHRRRAQRRQRRLEVRDRALEVVDVADRFLRRR